MVRDPRSKAWLLSIDEFGVCEEGELAVDGEVEDAGEAEFRDDFRWVDDVVDEPKSSKIDLGDEREDDLSESLGFVSREEGVKLKDVVVTGVIYESGDEGVAGCEVDEVFEGDGVFTVEEEESADRSVTRASATHPPEKNLNSHVAMTLQLLDLLVLVHLFLRHLNPSLPFHLLPDPHPKHIASINYTLLTPCCSTSNLRSSRLAGQIHLRQPGDDLLRLLQSTLNRSDASTRCEESCFDGWFRCC